ncbi:enoyl-CoA hydratase-related protein [Streptomyces sp. NPDC048291]|uniref:enoyl-CoA hydratase-related protein n=1 Tax=Streptomyces sp. NPDC048291 TaxID=3365530 RepID=UPI00371DD753
MSALLPRAVGARLAHRMMLTGEPIDARRPPAAGLVTEVVPHDCPLDLAREIAALIRAAHPGSVAEPLALLADGEDTSLARARALEARATDVAEVACRFGSAPKGRGELRDQPR